MSDYREKIKMIDFKKVLYAAIFLGIAVYLFISFAGKSKGQPEHSGSVLIKDKKPKEREFFTAYKADAQSSAQKSAYNPETELRHGEDYSDKTDDEDVERLQEMLREQRFNKSNTRFKDAPQNRYASENHSAGQNTTPPIDPVNEITEKKVANYPDSENEQPEEKRIEMESSPPDRFSKTMRGVGRANTVSVLTLREQTVTQGSTLRLILQESMKLENGITLPEKTIITGVVAFSGDRINVHIGDVVLNGSLVPVNKSVYDIDGQKGIATSQNVESLSKKRTVEQVAGGIPVGGVVGSGVNAAANAVRSIFNSSTDSYEISIRANYKLFLR